MEVDFLYFSLMSFFLASLSVTCIKPGVIRLVTFLDDNCTEVEIQNSEEFSWGVNGCVKDNSQDDIWKFVSWTGCGKYCKIPPPQRTAIFFIQNTPVASFFLGGEHKFVSFISQNC